MKTEIRKSPIFVVMYQFGSWMPRITTAFLICSSATNFMAWEKKEKKKKGQIQEET